jgi:5'-nucleotidase
MSLALTDKLVVGISSRALFDLEEENRIYEQDGLKAYSEYQTQFGRHVNLNHVLSIVL